MSIGLHVARLTIFPVKGLAGIDVSTRGVGPRGLEGDRRWMVVDASGRFISQRTEPGMILVRTAWISDPRGGDRIRLSTPGQEPIELPATPSGEAPQVEVTLWNDQMRVPAPVPEAGAWMSEVLGAPVRLVFQPDSVVRPADPRHAPGAEVSFADGYPVLVVGQASLDELNRHLDAPVPMDRFRPNVVVNGNLRAHEEDRWRRFRLGDVPCAGVKLCARCAVTTVDTVTAERGKEPLRTLATYRGWGGKVWFGQNVVPEASGRVSVGDPVTVLERGPVGP